MTHCVNLSIKRFYKCYIEDDKCEMTDSQLREIAMNRALSGENLVADEEMGTEDQDISIGDMYSF